MVITVPSTAKMWKYLSIALMGILATGFLVPQAYAHVTSNIQHNLEHVVNFLTGLDTKVTAIKAKTDTNLDATVSSRATQTSVDGLQTTANTINTKIDNLPSSSGSSEFKTIRTLIHTNVESEDRMTCTSDSDYMIYATVAEGLGSSDENDILQYSDGATFSAGYVIVQSGTFTFSGVAGENAIVALIHNVPFGSTALVTLQTAAGATANCVRD